MYSNIFKANGADINPITSAALPLVLIGNRRINTWVIYRYCGYLIPNLVCIIKLGNISRIQSWFEATRSISSHLYHSLIRIHEDPVKIETNSYCRCYPTRSCGLLRSTRYKFSLSIKNSPDISLYNKLPFHHVKMLLCLHSKNLKKYFISKKFMIFFFICGCVYIFSLEFSTDWQPEK